MISKNDEKIIALIDSLLNQETGQMEEAYVKLKNSRNKSVAPVLIRYLDSKNPLIRRLTASILGERREKDAVFPLIEKLKDNDIGVILSAIIALGDIGDKKATEPLTKMLKDESPFFYFIRLNTADTLAKIGDRRAVPQLIEAIKEDDLLLMRSTIEALLTIDPESTVNPLIEILNDEKALFKDLAAEFLGIIKDTKAVKPLIKILDDSDIEVKICAVQALGKIENDESLFPVIKLYMKTDNDILKKNIRETIKNVLYFITVKNKTHKKNIINEIEQFIKEYPESEKKQLNIIELSNLFKKT